MDITSLFKSARLQEAIDQATESVRRNPGRFHDRWTLAELLCFTEALTRADKQLDFLESMESEGGELVERIAQAGTDAVTLLEHADPEAKQRMQRFQHVRQFRNLIRAEEKRRDVFLHGNLPEFVSPPNDEIRLRLEALVAYRKENAERTAVCLAGAEEQRRSIAGTCGDTSFDEFRDVGDFTASCLEMLTPNGKYYWISLNELKSVQFSAPECARDVLWRPAAIEFNSDQRIDAFIGCVYPASEATGDAELQLGRRVDWIDVIGDFCCGSGGKLMAIDDSFVPLVQISSIMFRQDSEEGKSDAT